MRAARKIGAGLLKRPLGDHRIEPRHVRRRPHIEQLAGDEGDSGGVLRRHAADFARGACPPGFLGEEGLLPQSVRKPFPQIVIETPIAALRLERSFHVLGQAMRGETREAGAEVHGLEAELDEPAGSVGKMGGPVEPGGVERVWRDALGKPRGHGAAETIHSLERGSSEAIVGGGFGAWACGARRRLDQPRRSFVHFWSTDCEWGPLAPRLN